jgi:uncharacterized protein (TIGR03084 family)
MEQAHDFWDETQALHGLIAGLSDSDFLQATQFKGWTINMVLRHLHVWNRAAGLSLTDHDGFAAFLNSIAAGVKGGALPTFEASYLDGLSGEALRDAWIAEAQILAKQFAEADPSARLPWVGPEMSARSSITARLMESWAHGQAVYDLLGVERRDSDRIGNIVRLGVNTFGWTFRNRQEEMPGPMPKLALTAPSGTLWTYGDGDGLISGSATEFCQVIKPATVPTQHCWLQAVQPGDGSQLHSVLPDLPMIRLHRVCAFGHVNSFISSITRWT